MGCRRALAVVSEPITGDYSGHDRREPELAYVALGKWLSNGLV